ncbi:MAG: polyribonucleotide nucleotidyltransferase, partial [Bacteroidetes bacterium]
QKETGTVITIQEEGNFGVIDIVSSDKPSIEAAKARINAIVAVPEVGEEYLGTVKNIVAFGAFVEILPGKDALLHISEIDWKRIDKVEDVLKVGDKIKVKLIGVDPRTGKLKLSRKVLIPRPERKDHEK